MIQQDRKLKLYYILTCALTRTCDTFQEPVHVYLPTNAHQQLSILLANNLCPSESSKNTARNYATPKIHGTLQAI